MRVETHSGEILATFSYASYVDDTYDEDARLRWLVDRAVDRYDDAHDECAFVVSCGLRPCPHRDLSTFIMHRLGSVERFTDLAVNHDHNTTEEPLIVAGPLPVRGSDIAAEDSGRWVALVWYDTGQWAPTSSPDRVVLLEGDDDSASYDACMLADLTGTGWVSCQNDDSHAWDYPAPYGDRPYEQYADNDGARCPECGGPLVVSFSVGEDGYGEGEAVPWPGNEPCEECEHGDHWGRVCGEGSFTWDRDDRCPCTHPDAPEDVAGLTRPECRGQLALVV